MSCNMQFDYDDSILLQRIKNDDDVAFKLIYDKYCEWVYLNAYKILREKPLSEDVMQEVFVAIWNGRTRLNIENLKSYLLVATRNKSLSKLRHIKFVGITEKIIQNMEYPSDYAKTFDDKKIIKQVLLIVEALPARCKEIFILNRIKGYSIIEISEQLNISKRTIENQLSIALKHIRKIIGEYQ